LCLHPVAAVQYTFINKQYTEYRERNTHNYQQKTKLGRASRAVFESYALIFALHLSKKHGKASVRVAENFPSISVAVIKYTFIHRTTQ
jgi:hypothetical protein